MSDSPENGLSETGTTNTPSSSGSVGGSVMEPLRKYAWALVALAWLGLLAGLGLLRFDPLGVTEAGAQALLLNWTVAERIINPIVAFGPPDFRALLFAPLGLYWPGNMLAVKLFCGLVAFFAALLVYRRMAAAASQEVALLGTALVLVAPITLLQINTLDAGPFLLLCFAIAAWVDRRYRARGKQLGGWYFLHMILIVTTVSIHPAGLAYPLALVWEWSRNPVDARQRKQVLIGTALAVAFILAFRSGWYGLSWLENPLVSLNAVLMAVVPEESAAPTMWGGAIIALLLGALALIAGKHIARDLVGRALLVAMVVGLPAADHAWAFLAFALLAYFGVEQLVALNSNLSGTALGQRGLVAAVFFVLATAFMLADKTYYMANQGRALSGQDRVLDTLATELADSKEAIKISSQWPARTMLATKHPAFPLPPVPENPEDLLPSIKTISYIVFDPYVEENRPLSTALSGNTAAFETTLLEDRAVLVTVRDASTESANASSSEPAAPPATDRPTP